MGMKKYVMIALMAALASAPALAADPEVDIIDGRDFMVAFAINNDMLVCGDNQISSTTTAVVWEPLVGAQIMPGSAGISQAGDINQQGDVVGWLTPEEGPSTAVVWYAEGGYQDWVETGLPPAVRPDTYNYTQGYSINNYGEVVLGASLQPYTQPDGSRIGFAVDWFHWSEETGFTYLPHLSGQRDSQAASINNNGVTVGSSVTLSGERHLVTWTRNGEVGDHGVPEGISGVYGMDINDHGVVTGYTDRNRDAFVWTEEGGFVILQDFGFNATAREINSSGYIAGVADAAPWDPVPVVWDPAGNIYDLRSIVGFDLYYLTEGVAINDNNQFVAYGIDLSTGRRQAVVLQLTFAN